MDTLIALLNRYPDAIGMWVVFIVLPVVTCALWTWLSKSKLPKARRAFSLSIALTLGYPALLLGFIILPITAFQIFIAPVLLESLPTWRQELLLILLLPNWFVEQAFWLAPVSWLLWIIIAPKVFINKQATGATK
jgi:hypothetical protein